MKIQLELSAAEAKILKEILESDLSDLRMEIADTDRQDFRDMLKGRKEAIHKVLDTLASIAEPVAAGSR